MPRLPKQNESSTAVADAPSEIVTKHVAEIVGGGTPLELTDKPAQETTPTATPEVTTAAASEVVTSPAAASASAIVEVPLPEVDRQSWGLHVNAQFSPEQSHALRRLTVGLDRSQATLASGWRVVNATDAVKYLLELISRAV